MGRTVQAGNAIPVAIVGSETSGGSFTAGGDVQVDELQFDSIGAHGSNAALTSVATLTPPPGATKLIMQALTQNVRYTLSPLSVPTASFGFQMKAGDPPVMIKLSSSTVVKVIQETATASLQYQFGA